MESREVENGKLKLENLPDGWQTIKVKYISTCNNETLGEETPDDFEIKYIDIGSVTNGKGIENIQDFYFKTAPSRARRVVHTDDVIISTVRTYLKAIASIPKEYDNYICSTGFAVITPNERIHHRFMQYALESDNFISNVEKYSVGISYPAINAEELINFKIYLPPQDQQKKIADFLDSKCSELQSAIDNTKQTIEEYKKLKQAVITKAVTKGLEPNRKMKASGIEWIGQIPEEWEVKRIKTLFDLRSEKNYLPLSEVNLISLYTDLGVRQHSDIEATTGNKAMNADGYKKVYKDDIVVNIILCWMGAIGRSDYEGVTSPAYDVYKPKENVNSRFYHYYFRTKGFNGDCFKRGKGIMLMRWRTYADYFRDISVVAPSETEQEKIVEYLDRKCSQIDTLISQKEQFITELEKYKQSLIYEYVTGKRVLN
jgi:type I restriction enzyme S subunit